MAELHKLPGVTTHIYHIERFHGPLKASLRKLCEEKPREWHRYLIPTLFALREVPSHRTGFSTFDLSYVRSVRGSLPAFRDLWEDRRIQGQERSSFQYIIELGNKLSECAKIPVQNADISSSRYKVFSDVRSEHTGTRYRQIL